MIYLDDESEILWADLFHDSERTASGWIKLKLNEEKSGALDPFLLMKQIQDITYQVQALEAEKKLLGERLDHTKELQKKKAEDRVSYVLDPRKTSVMANTMKTLYNLDAKKAQELADKYLSIDSKDRPELPKFMNKELKEQVA